MSLRFFVWLLNEKVTQKKTLELIIFISHRQSIGNIWKNWQNQMLKKLFKLSKKYLLITIPIPVSAHKRPEKVVSYTTGETRFITSSSISTQNLYRIGYTKLDKSTHSTAWICSLAFQFSSFVYYTIEQNESISNWWNWFAPFFRRTYGFTPIT